MKLLTNKTYSLCEAVSDISFIAGQQGYYSGNSRSDIAKFIEWAQEFETIHKGEIWGEGELDYIDAITEFATKKLSFIR